MTDEVKITTPPELTGKQYAAIAKFAAQVDSRPVLAALKITEDHAVAADGFRLAVVNGHSEIDRDESNAKKTLLVRWPDVAALGLKARRIVWRWLASGYVTANADHAKRDNAAPEWVSKEHVAPVDGTFPDYTKIVPKQGEGPSVHLNAHFLRDACDLAIALGGPGRGKDAAPRIELTAIAGGDKPYLIKIPSVNGGPSADVVIVPMCVESDAR